ncbi:MAG: hypothetical protein A2Z81_02440 [Omnitrophica WOR_2 bacterium GWA2_45_18]|nr:MAG: hypothetical protein A2Z81_02440 [Omnitrophica WOR_2 bacterium GWA2_45_18]
MREHYDLLVIGGGINGAAIAHMAVLNGLKTALVEKNDFASGTSSKSSKLIHGGLRYLENFEWGLVQESLKERFVQMKNAPHLVHPLGFIIPVYKQDRRPLWLIKMGVSLYDFLSGPYVIQRHRFLRACEIQQLVPGVKSDNLLGGVLFYDAQMNDARLCLENVLSADQLGARVANYIEVKGLIKDNGRAVGVEAYDSIERRFLELRAKKIVCALGPWTDSLMRKDNPGASEKMRLSKGVHLVYRGIFSEHALLVPTREDRRIFFVIPWLSHTLIGTTDTEYTDGPDKVEVKEEDIVYLFQELEQLFPEHVFRKENIITSFAGLRPLSYQKGPTAKVSRRHVIERSYSGVFYVIGGKYTTYRKIAEDCLKTIMPGKIVDTEKDFPVYGSGPIQETPAQASRRYDIDQETAQALMQFYGARYQDVLALTARDPQFKQRICSCSPVIRAQVVYAVEVEMALKEEDVLLRRLTLGYNDCRGGQCRREVRKMLAGYFHQEGRSPS